ncbi:MAG TPA: DMT family transporter [Halieaceae bacterium]|nr:DMT family transporter [Halieaceae bacterium]
MADAMLLVTAIIWGINVSVVKKGLEGISPLVFNAVRFSIACVVMRVMIYALGRRMEFTLRHLFMLVSLGLLGTTGYQFFFLQGLSRTTAGTAAVLLATTPAWTAAIGCLLRRDRVTSLGWLGVAISIAGAVCIVLGPGDGAGAEMAGSPITGGLMIICSVICWSTFTVLLRPFVRIYSPMMVTYICTLGGTVPLLFLAIGNLQSQDWAAISGFSWASMVYSGVLAVAMGYFLWNWGLARLGSARTSVYANLLMPVALLAAWLVLGESLSLLQWLGIFLALVGVFLARHHSHPINDV